VPKDQVFHIRIDRDRSSNQHRSLLHGLHGIDEFPAVDGEHAAVYVQLTCEPIPWSAV
jgi:hypothetical protein